mmetsp:Transcript_116302/g.370065  ORF Transcript_116302/g.370065 Transcript_116302/m.370065 type:complete len:242 (+) Transcript_116302:190-915(+)
MCSCCILRTRLVFWLGRLAFMWPSAWQYLHISSASRQIPRKANTQGLHPPKAWAASPFMGTDRFSGGVEAIPLKEAPARPHNSGCSDSTQDLSERRQNSCAWEDIAFKDSSKLCKLSACGSTNWPPSNHCCLFGLSFDNASRSRSFRKAAATKSMHRSFGISKNSAIFSNSSKTSLGSKDPKRPASNIPTVPGRFTTSCAQASAWSYTSPNMSLCPNLAHVKKSAKSYGLPWASLRKSHVT